MDQTQTQILARAFSISKKPKVLDDLPDEILQKIFNKLPAEAVGMCMCVKKPWLTLIRTPTFVSSFKPPDDDRFFVFFKNREELLLHRDNKTFEYHKTLTIPIKSDTTFWRAMQSLICNGLVCCGKDHSTIILWNPTIGKMVTLPPSNYVLSTSSNISFSTIIGFGFDSRTTDYKVLRILQSKKLRLDPHIEAFSLKNNSWTTIYNAPRYFLKTYSISNNSCVAGAIHWIATEFDSNNVILGFDLNSETFQEIQLPYSLGKTESEIDVSVYKESFLAVWNIYRDDNSIEIWVMKEYGNVESWMPVWEYDFSALKSKHNISRYVNMLGFHIDGGVLLYVWCDNFQDMIVLVNHETEEDNQLAFTTHESFVTYLCFQYFPKNLMLLDNVNAVRCPANETLTRGANINQFSRYDYTNASDYLAIDDINNLRIV